MLSNHHMSNHTESANKMPVIIAGASGLVGIELTKHIAKRSDMYIVGAISSPNSRHLGKNLSTMANICKMEINISNDIEDVFSNAPEGTGLIDFSSPKAALHLAPAVAEMGSVYVVGTTGHSNETNNVIKKAASKIPVIQSDNMSYAMVVLSELAERAAELLKTDDWDINITERHREGKRDKPAGTTKMLKSLMKKNNPDRDIEVLSSRRKYIVCDQEIYFEGENERVILSHHARGRNIFAKGAVNACLWGKGKEPGLYNMRNVVGLN